MNERVDLSSLSHWLKRAQLPSLKSQFLRGTGFMHSRWDGVPVDMRKTYAAPATRSLSGIALVDFLLDAESEYDEDES